MTPVLSQEDYETITTRCTGSRHWLGTSERNIFSKIPFIDYGYFYDWDQRWYYVEPGPFRVKYPLELLINVLQSGIREYDFSFNAQRRLLTYILQDYPKQDNAFQELLFEYETDANFILKKLLSVVKKV